MQLTAASVTPPAEHAARRPAGTAGASAADADVRKAGVLMKRSKQLGRILGGAAILFLLVAFIPGCGDEVIQPSSGEQGIVTRVVVQPHRAAPGEKLVLTIVIENRSAEPFEGTFGQKQVDFTIEIIQSKEFIYDSCPYTPAVVSHLSIPAWGSKTFYRTVSTDRAGYACWNWPLAEDVLPPGLYKIRGGMMGGEHQWETDFFYLE
jgi:hypothetical protein